jgi:UDP-glucose 4-epimerase
MTVLVTGGAGYIGSHMVWSLIEAGEDVAVLDSLSTGFEWAVAPEATFYKGDIADRDLLGRIFRSHDIDAVIHFAGSVVVPDSVSNPLRYYENNTVRTRALIEAVIEANIKHFVFSSTAAVYGTPQSTNPVLESDPLQPESPYGSSKLMTEIMLRDAAAAHPAFTYTALRYFNVAGSDPKGRVGQSTVGATHLLKVACETALGKRSSISVYGTDYGTPDGTCVRDYIHVTDLTDAHLKALNRMRNGGTSLTANCGYGKGFSVLEVLNCVRKVSGANFAVNYTGRRPGDATSVVANTEIANRVLGWVPRYNNLEIIVGTALEWEKHLSMRNLI